MEHDKMDDNNWVNDRLASLQPSRDWQPDSVAAFARLRRRGQPRGHRWWLLASVSFAAAVVCVALVLLSTPSACANPLGCREPLPNPTRPAPAPAPAPVVTPAPEPKAPKSGAHPAKFKVSGSPTAPVTCEVYTDFECPHCATFYLQTLTSLASEYVETGKLRIVHRDFPLAQHAHSALAARYANAAGELGYYDAAARRLFQTQAVWSGDGDIDRALSPALPGAIMVKIRQMIRTPDESLAADQAMAAEDRLHQTPTVVLVHAGHRDVVAGNLSYPDLKSRIDGLLAQ